MSGFSAFQANTFNNYAFQSGVSLVAGDYSLSLSFSTPILTHNYHLAVFTEYDLGSLDFDVPAVTEISLILHANPYSLSSLDFASVFMRSFQKLSAITYSLGSPDFSVPGFNAGVHRLFTNSMSLSPLDFAKPVYIPHYPFIGAGFDISGLAFTSPSLNQVQHVAAVNEYSLGKLSFGYPRLTQIIVVTDYPPTYFTQVESTSNMLRDYLNLLLASIPIDADKDAVDNARVLINTLRSNAEVAIRGITLGSDLEDIHNAVYDADATYSGVEAARQFLMQQTGSNSLFTQMALGSMLTMCLALESSIIVTMKFTTRDEAQNMVLHVRDMFDAAKDLGIDEASISVYQTLNAMGGAVVNHLALAELQLPRVIEYQTQMPMPSLYLANRIYQDASRADEITEANGVIHPAFCPVNLRVLSNAKGLFR
jgi:hypothetical protein